MDTEYLVVYACRQAAASTEHISGLFIKTILVAIWQGECLFAGVLGLRAFYPGQADCVLAADSVCTHLA